MRDKETKYKRINLCFTWHTTARKIYDTLEEKLEKKRMNLYSAPIRKRAVIFIDDVNLPRADPYGTVPAMEFLRGLVEHSGYYDNARYYWKRFTKTSFLCLATPASGGRKEMSQRFYRHFNVLYMNTTSYVEAKELFEPVLAGHFATFPREMALAKSGYFDSLIELREALAARLPGTPRNPHYLLNYKDMAKVLSGSPMLIWT